MTDQSKSKNESSDHSATINPILNYTPEPFLSKEDLNFISKTNVANNNKRKTTSELDSNADVDKETKQSNFKAETIDDIKQNLYIPSSLTNKVAYASTAASMDYIDDEYGFDEEEESDGVFMLFPVVCLRLGWGLFNNPLYVATTLRQIQYRPTKEYRASLGLNHLHLQSEEEVEYKQKRATNPYDIEESLDDANKEEEDILAARFNAEHGMSRINNGLSEVVLDSYGYIVQQTSRSAELAKPFYQLPLTESKGIFSMIKQVYYSTSEGFFSLFKGNTYAVVESIIRDYLDITALRWVEYLLPESLITYDKLSLGRVLLSMFFSGWVTTPLDYLRTKTILQSKTVKSISTYWGEMKDAISEVTLTSVSVLKGMEYVLELSATAGIEALIIEAVATNDVSGYISSGISLALVDAIIITILSTIRQRLLAQHAIKSVKRKGENKLSAIQEIIDVFKYVNPFSSINQENKVLETVSEDDIDLDGSYVKCTEKFRPIVDISPTPYTGVFDCIYRMIKEEGFSSLTYGFSLRFSSNLFVVFSRLVTGMVTIEYD